VNIAVTDTIFDLYQVMKGKEEKPY